MAERAPRITVIAGTNGCGKSSIAGEALRDAGGRYFNPDEAARAFRVADPSLSADAANSAAWLEGKRLLELAIAERSDFTFETTLGGTTIKDLLLGACAAGIEVAIWFAGLASPEIHIERVRARVARGGHDISPDLIRRRYEASRVHLIELLPRLAILQVYDNSATVDLDGGEAPRPTLLLHMRGGKVVSHVDLRAAPAWAKPILAAALLLVPPAKRRLSLPARPRRRR